MRPILKAVLAIGEIQTLHRPFAKWLRDQGVYFISPRSDRESTINAGHPDFSILMRNNVLLIEFKTKEGTLSADQKACIAELDAAGNKVHVIRDLSVAIELVQQWLSTLKEPVNTASTPRKLHRMGTAIYEEKDGQLHKVR